MYSGYFAYLWRERAATSHTLLNCSCHSSLYRLCASCWNLLKFLKLLILILLVPNYLYITNDICITLLRIYLSFNIKVHAYRQHAIGAWSKLFACRISMLIMSRYFLHMHRRRSNLACFRGYFDNCVSIPWSFFLARHYFM